MKTRNIVIVLCLIVMVMSSCITVSAKEIDYTIPELKELIAEQVERQDKAHNLAESARDCGFNEDAEIILYAQNDWNEAKRLIRYYTRLLEQLEEELKASEYPVATEVWNYMKDLGWNDYVCAGILGNMMAEVGGGTLDLIEECNTGNGFYGLCQWNQLYCEEVWYKDLYGQLDFLRDSIKDEIDLFGFIYKTNFNFDSFLKLENERDAAIAFAVCYERGASQYTQIRADYAEKAYDYFVGK